MFYDCPHMPIYEYQCENCHRMTEKLLKVSEKGPKKCEHCGGKLTRVISRTSFQLKGGGWYKDLYASSKPGSSSDSGESSGSASSDAKADSKTDTKPAAKAESKSDAKSEKAADKGGKAAATKPAPPAAKGGKSASKKAG
jgi:putative FmdB family regulatory protein